MRVAHGAEGFTRLTLKKRSIEMGQIDGSFVFPLRFTWVSFVMGNEFPCHEYGYAMILAPLEFSLRFWRIFILSRIVLSVKQFNWYSKGY